MNDYRTHDGIDIACKAGDEVFAVSGGTIQNVYYDPLMGYCVSIDHGKGMVTTYKNLAESLPEGIHPKAAVELLARRKGEAVAAEVTGGRHFSARRNLHALAWISYLAENGPEGAERESLTAQARRLEELSRFELLLEGEADADTLAALREEAIYTSSVKERRAHERELPFGNRIIHERNRYHLSASLTGHSKRGSRHYWETVISLCLDGSEPFTPEIDTLTVDGAFNAASRGGVTLPQDKFSSQVILSSEIGLNGVRSPLSVDLILDIAYISAVKCGSCEIKVSGTEYIDGWAVMDCQVYLY